MLVPTFGLSCSLQVFGCKPFDRNAVRAPKCADAMSARTDASPRRSKFGKELRSVLFTHDSCSVPGNIITIRLFAISASPAAQPLKSILPTTGRMRCATGRLIYPEFFARFNDYLRDRSVKGEVHLIHIRLASHHLGADRVNHGRGAEYVG